jgi:hypothetical protein
VPSQPEPELSESQARRASALKSALGPLTDLLDDPRVVEVMLNADGVVWVPGVRPRVRLLMELGTAGRIRLAKSLIAYLVRTGRHPSAMPDIFYLRVAAALGGRLPGHKILLSLLPPSTRRGRRSRAPWRKPNRSRRPHQPHRSRAPGRIAASTGKSC